MRGVYLLNLWCVVGHNILFTYPAFCLQLQLSEYICNTHENSIGWLKISKYILYTYKKEFDNADVSNYQTIFRLYKECIKYVRDMTL